MSTCTFCKYTARTTDVRKHIGRKHKIVMPSLASEIVMPSLASEIVVPSLASEIVVPTNIVLPSVHGYHWTKLDGSYGGFIACSCDGTVCGM